jgi:Effector-associated domain 11
MIRLHIKIMIGFFLSLLLLILMPQILLTEIYGDSPYIVLIWLLLNFTPHALLLFYKRDSYIMEYKNLLNSILVGYYLLIMLPILLRTYFLAANGILPVQQLVKSLWALIPLQLIYIFIVLYSTKSNEIPTPYDTVTTMNKDSFLEKLQELIGDNRIEQAINLSFGFYKKDRDISNHLILLKKRLNAINKKESMGTTSLDDAEIERNRVSKALLDIAAPQ